MRIGAVIWKVGEALPVIFVGKRFTRRVEIEIATVREYIDFGIGMGRHGYWD